MLLADRILAALAYQGVHQDRKLTEFHRGHETYCAGHLIQAAVAVARSTGREELLAVATAFADLLVRRFGANYFQDHAPVREATEATGHAVRQLYLAAGVTDVYLEQGDAALLTAMERLWDDMYSRKTYITGAHGSRHRDEAFGDPYELPPDRAYAETCAAIAGFQWNWRLLLATGLALHLLTPGEVTAELPGGPAVLSISTAYPWEETASIVVDSEHERTLALRIPAWCRRSNDSGPHHRGSGADGVPQGIPQRAAEEGRVLPSTLPERMRDQPGHGRTERAARRCVRRIALEFLGLRRGGAGLSGG